MKITVVITTWRVPFDQIVNGIHQFDDAETARTFINATSKKWWDDNEGERCMAEMPETDPYEPIAELGYNHARYELWGGENGFQAMIDEASYKALHEAHYKREYDDKGEVRPGYLLNAAAADGTITPEQEKQRDEALKKLKIYGPACGNA